MVPSALGLNSVYSVLLSYCKNNAVRECNMHTSLQNCLSVRKTVYYIHTKTV